MATFRNRMHICEVKVEERPYFELLCEKVDCDDVKLIEFDSRPEIPVPGEDIKIGHNYKLYKVEGHMSNAVKRDAESQFNRMSVVALRRVVWKHGWNKWFSFNHDRIRDDGYLKHVLADGFRLREDNEAHYQRYLDGLELYAIPQTARM